MTEPAQVRFKIDPELHTEFKAQCMRSGVSMADQTARMISQFVDSTKTENTDSNGSGDCVESLLPEEVAPEQLLGTNALEAMLQGKLEPIIDALGKAATRSNIAWLNENQSMVARDHHDALTRTVASIETRVADSVENSHRRWQSVHAKNRRDRYWLGGAALAGMAALSLLLMLASGTRIGRSLAVSLTGADTRWDAALSLAGNGSPLHARMMSETRTLLNDPSFREAYVACVERAKRAKAPLSCALKLPPLREVI
jgi:hypothetical protein